GRAAEVSQVAAVGGKDRTKGMSGSRRQQTFLPRRKLHLIKSTPLVTFVPARQPVCAVHQALPIWRPGDIAAEERVTVILFSFGDLFDIARPGVRHPDLASPSGSFLYHVGDFGWSGAPLDPSRRILHLLLAAMAALRRAISQKGNALSIRRPAWCS